MVVRGGSHRSTFDHRMKQTSRGSMNPSRTNGRLEMLTIVEPNADESGSTWVLW